MTPALTRPAASAEPGTTTDVTHDAEPKTSARVTHRAEPQPRREHLEPARPLAPVAACGALPQMRVERRAGDARRQRLAVDAGGYGGTKLTAVHPAIVPGADASVRTTPRAGGRRA